MVDLPESARWHPLRAARHYEVRAEEAAGIALDAFVQYADLRAQFRAREFAADPAQSKHAVDSKWGMTGDARKCVSDLGTFSNMAQMFAAMASMKHSRYLSDREYRKSEGTKPVEEAVDPE